MMIDCWIQKVGVHAARAVLHGLCMLLHRKGETLRSAAVAHTTCHHSPVTLTRI